MKSPVTYRGYDKEANLIVSKTGANANDQLNPNIVKQKIENIDRVFDEQITKIQKALYDIVDDASKAVVINNSHLGTRIEELAEALNTQKGIAGPAFEQVYTDSILVHDQIQDNNNSEAYTAVKNYSEDIVSIR